MRKLVSGSCPKIRSLWPRLGRSKKTGLELDKAWRFTPGDEVAVDKAWEANREAMERFVAVSSQLIQHSATLRCELVPSLSVRVAGQVGRCWRVRGRRSGLIWGSSRSSRRLCNRLKYKAEPLIGLAAAKIADGARNS